MFKITESAGVYFSQVLSRMKTAGFNCIRLLSQAGTLRLEIGNIKKMDKRYFYDGTIVLVMDEELSKTLAGRTLDVEVTEGGPRLRLI